MLAGSLIRRYGILKTIVIGTILSSSGYIASSFADNIYILYVTYGALPGLGLVMISLSSLIAVGQHFDQDQALAMGICQSGGSVGGFIFNPLLQKLILVYGWRGAVLILSGILMHAALFGLMIHTLEQPKHKTNTTKSRKPKQERNRADEEKPFTSEKGKQSTATSLCDTCKNAIEETDLIKEHVDVEATAEQKQEMGVSIEETTDLVDSHATEHDHIVNQVSYDEKGSECCTDKILRILHQVIPYRIFKHRPTCVVLISSHIRSFGFFVPFMLLPDLAVERGISIDRAAWLASGAGIAGAVSRVVLGWIGGFPSVDRLYLYISCLLIGGALTAVCPLLTMYSMLMVYACMFGWLMGGEVALTPVICSDVAGKDKLPETYGMLRTLCGVGALCGTPLSGWLFETTGGYSMAFILSGTLVTVSGFILFLLKSRCLGTNYQK